MNHLDAPRSTILLRQIALLVFAVGCGLAACSDEDATDGTSTAGVVHFQTEAPLFPELDYTTGLQPPMGSIVQASFSVTASAGAQLDATATASGSADAATISGEAGAGRIALSGGFALVGRLVINVSGLPPYDGPIPGIENVEIPFSDETAFDPFSIGTAQSARADLPPSSLPGIPLPGGLPGELVLQIAAGSFVEVAFTGTCAGVDGDTASYQGTLARSGALVIQPVITLEVPLLGSQSYEIPSFTVDLALGSSDVAMTAPLEGFGQKPAQGDHQSGACDAAVAGSGGGGNGGDGGNAGNAGNGGGGGGTSCTSAADCSGLPCVMGQCSPGGGVCGSGLTFDDPDFESCLNASCCAEIAACTYDYSDIAGCNDCLEAGGGPRCDAYIACASTCFGSDVCNSGVSAEPLMAQCLSTQCCTEFNACTSFGANAGACVDCMVAGGGPLCNDALDCWAANCG